MFISLIILWYGDIFTLERGNEEQVLHVNFQFYVLKMCPEPDGSFPSSLVQITVLVTAVFPLDSPRAPLPRPLSLATPEGGM